MLSTVQVWRPKLYKGSFFHVEVVFETHPVSGCDRGTCLPPLSTPFWIFGEVLVQKFYRSRTAKGSGMKLVLIHYSLDFGLVPCGSIGTC